MLKAMNLVTRRDAGDEALGGRSPPGRNLFLVPWRERALFGTWESDRACDPADTTIDEARRCAVHRRAQPGVSCARSDARGRHARCTAASCRRSSAAIAWRSQGHEQVRDHAAEGVEGLVSVAGAKYTTARAVAERVTDRLWRSCSSRRSPCRTASTPLPGGSIRDVGLAIADARREHDQGLPTDTIPHLIAAYGSRYRDVMELAAERPEWRTRIAQDSPVIGAELVQAVRNEMAMTLADAVIRRTPLGALGYPGDDAVERAAAIVGGELGWSDERRREEIAQVKRFYEGVALG